MTTVESAHVVWNGAAIELRLSGGARRVVRSIDVVDARGDATVSSSSRLPRAGELVLAISSVRLRGGALEVAFDDGSERRLSSEQLLALEHTQRHELSVPPPERPATLVIDNAGILLTAEARTDDPLGRIGNGAVVVCDGRVAWLGPSQDLGQCGRDLSDAYRLDAEGRLVTPGLVDCHSHPLFGGDRAGEFGMRAAGRGYLEIAAAGGGIKATIEPTRALSLAEHVSLTAARMTRALACGTTTSEAKSGYDLSADGELRLLEVAQAVDGRHPVDLSPTLLGAHVLPPEYADDREGFVALVAEHMIPRASERGLTNCADVYCDEGAFTLDETRTILRAARDAGMHVRAHIGQFADLGGAELLAELGGLSADHLENVSEQGMAAMAAAGVAAVMLPGACVQLRMQPPPVAALRAAGVAMAVASDLNPGTSMCEALPVQMWLATTHYGMTVEEAWLGVTRVAAQVLGRADIGRLVPGARADLVLWNASQAAEIPYRYGADLVDLVIKSGRPV